MQPYVMGSGLHPHRNVAEPKKKIVASYGGAIGQDMSNFLEKLRQLKVPGHLNALEHPNAINTRCVIKKWSKVVSSLSIGELPVPPRVRLSEIAMNGSGAKYRVLSCLALKDTMHEALFPQDLRQLREQLRLIRGQTRPLAQVDLMFLVAFCHTRTGATFLALPSILINPICMVQDGPILRCSFGPPVEIDSFEFDEYTILSPPVALTIVASLLASREHRRGVLLEEAIEQSFRCAMSCPEKPRAVQIADNIWLPYAGLYWWRNQRYKIDISPLDYLPNTRLDSLPISRMPTMPTMSTTGHSLKWVCYESGYAFLGACRWHSNLPPTPGLMASPEARDDRPDIRSMLDPRARYGLVSTFRPSILEGNLKELRQRGGTTASLRDIDLSYLIVFCRQGKPWVQYALPCILLSPFRYDIDFKGVKTLISEDAVGVRTFEWHQFYVLDVKTVFQIITSLRIRFLYPDSSDEENASRMSSMFEEIQLIKEIISSSILMLDELKFKLSTSTFFPPQLKNALDAEGIHLGPEDYLPGPRIEIAFPPAREVAMRDPTNRFPARDHSNLVVFYTLRDDGALEKTPIMVDLMTRFRTRNQYHLSPSSVDRSFPEVAHRFYIISTFLPPEPREFL